MGRLWPAVLAAWLALPAVLWWRLAPNGYNTTDYGFIVGQSWRVLHGEVPHRDFISARPAGSAYLHLVDFAIPLPLVESSRLIAIVIVVLIGLLSGVAVLGELPHRWSVTGHVVALTAVLFTLNTFPIGPWYTADGMLFALASIAALRLWSEHAIKSLPVAALLCAGAAPLMKQSFFLTVPLAFVWVQVVLWRSGRLSLSRCVRTAWWVGLPGLLYVLSAAVAGALTPMVSQLTNATTPDWFGKLGSVSVVTPFRIDVLLALTILAAVCSIWLFMPSRQSTTSQTPWAVVASAAYLGTIGLATLAHFNMYDIAWTTRLFWLAVLTSIVASVSTRRVRAGDLGVISVAWMIVLSWGLPIPLLAAGGLLLVIAQGLAEPTGDVLRSPGGGRRIAAIWCSAAVLGLAMTAIGLDEAIQHRVIHRDLPAAQLSSPLRPLDGDFGRVRTNPSTARLLQDALDCRRQHPARSTVFGSWNSDLYAILGARNPLATDGANNYEITGAEEQYRESVTRLGERGDYLFLFPLLNPETVQDVAVDALPLATAETPIPEYWFTSSVPYSWTASQLTGTRVQCGTWVGVYSPPEAP